MDKLTPVLIGVVTDYFSTLRVVAIRFYDDCDWVIHLGDKLRFGSHPDSAKRRTKRVIINSMERWHKSIQEAKGPEPVAIFTGSYIHRGVPVFLLVRPI